MCSKIPQEDTVQAGRRLTELRSLESLVTISEFAALGKPQRERPRPSRLQSVDFDGTDCSCDDQTGTLYSDAGRAYATYCDALMARSATQMDVPNLSALPAAKP